MFGPPKKTGPAQLKMAAKGPGLNQLTDPDLEAAQKDFHAVRTNFNNATGELNKAVAGASPDEKVLLQASIKHSMDLLTEFGEHGKKYAAGLDPKSYAGWIKAANDLNARASILIDDIRKPLDKSGFVLPKKAADIYETIKARIKGDVKTPAPVLAPPKSDSTSPQRKG